jgi:hypothetical protein
MMKEENVDDLIISAFHQEEAARFFDLGEAPISVPKLIKSRANLTEVQKAENSLSPEAIYNCVKQKCGISRGAGDRCPNNHDCKECFHYSGGAFSAVSEFRKNLWKLPSLETKVSSSKQNGRLNARKARMISILAGFCQRDAAGHTIKMRYVIGGLGVCKYFFKV